MTISGNGSSKAFVADDAEVVQQDASYRGFFSLDTIHLRHKLFAGGWSPMFTRELFIRSPAAGVLLYDPVQDSVVLVEQFRVGAVSQSKACGDSPWLLEVVAGMIDKDERADQLVRREAMEEAGCEIKELVPICDYYSSPGGTSERISLFCGHVDSTNAGGVHGLPEENEDIRVSVLSFDQAWFEMQSVSGRLDNAMSIIALQWLFINRDKLKAAWLGE